MAAGQRNGRSRGQSDGLHRRQPEREKRGKRGASIDPHGFDAGKLVKGKKRHILVDKLGLLLHALVTAAGVQDRDGGVLLLSTFFGQFPFLCRPFAKSTNAGPVYHDGIANALPNREIDIVKRCDGAKDFIVEPQRRLVERSIG